MNKKQKRAAEAAAATLAAQREAESVENFEWRDDDFQLCGLSHIKADVNFQAQSFWRDARIRFMRNKGAVFALFCIAAIILLAILGPMMTGYTYSGQIIAQQNLAPRVPGLENLGIFNGDLTLKTTTGHLVQNGYLEKGFEDVYYWFGSDTLGRDIWTRTWTGTRVSLYIALVAVICDMVLGMSYGLISGYFGGKLDTILQRIAEVVNSIPTLVIVTLLLIVLEPGLQTDHAGPDPDGLDWYEPDCPRTDAQAQGTGIRIGIPYAGRPAETDYLQGDPAQYHFPADHQYDVFDPERHFYRGIFELCRSGRTYAYVLSWLAD